MKILLIAPTAHNYYKDIMACLCNKFRYDVDFIPDFNASFYNRSIRFCSKRLSKYVQNHYIKKKVSSKCFMQHYDIIFIIRGYAYNKNTIQFLKTKFHGAKFILYQWDPLNISLFDTAALNLFHKCFTFDYSDAKLYSLQQKALFYSETYNQKVPDCDIDVSFIGADHSNRLQIIQKLSTIFAEKDIGFYVKLNCNRFKFYFKKIFDHHTYKQINKNWFSYSAIPRDKVQDIFNRSRAILDIHHPSQNGLSIRIIEVVSKNKKLITTNSNVVLEPFYNPAMIKIIDSEYTNISKDFILSPNIKMDIESYRIDNWLNYILK